MNKRLEFVKYCEDNFGCEKTLQYLSTLAGGKASRYNANRIAMVGLVATGS